MKQKINYSLSVVRKFGFIMAAIMMFPYVTAFPAVMASDGEEVTSESYEASMEELEAEYAQVEADFIEEQRVSDKLEKYLVLHEDGTLTLVIPEELNLEVSDEIISSVVENLENVNESVKNGEVFIDEDFNIYVSDYDTEFSTLSVYADKFNWVWGGFKLWLTESSSAVVGLFAFVIATSVSYVTSKTLIANINNYIGGGVNYYSAFVGKIIPYISYINYFLIGSMALQVALASTGLGAAIVVVLKVVLMVYGSYIGSKGLRMAWYGLRGYDTYTRFYFGKVTVTSA